MLQANIITVLYAISFKKHEDDFLIPLCGRHRKIF